MQTGTEDDGIEQVDGENSVNRRTFVQGVGMLPLSTSLLDNEEARQQLDLGNSAHGSGRTRRFTIHAIEVDIVYNRFGLHQPNGVMYVLDENLDAVREASGETPDDAFSLVENETASAEQRGNPNEDDGEVDTSLIEPLVIRANEGDTIQIRFVNHLDRQASIHQTALPYNVQTSDGMAVGLNPDTTAKPGGTVQYRWEATHTGTHFFYDGANQAVDSANEPPEEANLLSRGLFGAIAVEPPGATWSDPETGGELHSGTKAVIDDPNGLGTTYREFVPFYHTPEGIEPEVQWPSTGEEQTIHAINYRPTLWDSATTSSTTRGRTGTQVAATTSSRRIRAIPSSTHSSEPLWKRITSTTYTSIAGRKYRARQPTPSIHRPSVSVIPSTPISSPDTVPRRIGQA